MPLETRIFPLPSQLPGRARGVTLLELMLAIGLVGAVLIVTVAFLPRGVMGLVQRIGARRPEVALLLPDQVVRVFLLHFETFPRRAEDAIPLLRWRLKKSVPFEMDETIVSYMPQPLAPGNSGGASVLAAVARQKVVRQYEEIVEGMGLRAGVALSSTLASLALLADSRPTLVVRLAGRTLTTVIVRGEALCVYRCTDVPQELAALNAAAVLEEIYPAVAFFQDSWRENIAEIRLAGFTARFDEFRRAVEAAGDAEFEFPDDHEERALYVVEGEVTVNDAVVAPQTVAVLGTDTSTVVSTSAGAKLMLFGGEPMDGERHISWNFVASERALIDAARERWRHQRFDPVPGETEFIPLPER